MFLSKLKAGNSLCLHFHFKALSNFWLSFCSFIYTINIIFPSAIFGYLWRCWHFFFALDDVILVVSGLHKLFRSDCRHVNNSGCIQFCRLSGRVILRNNIWIKTYPQSVNRILGNVCTEKVWIHAKYEFCHKSIKW